MSNVGFRPHAHHFGGTGQICTICGTSFAHSASIERETSSKPDVAEDINKEVLEILKETPSKTPQSELDKYWIEFLAWAKLIGTREDMRPLLENEDFWSWYMNHKLGETK